MKHLADKVAAITGAGSGLGRSLALVLADEGCHLALADINLQGLQETARLLEGKPIKTSSQQLDVADREQVYAWADATVREHGAVDLIINNAGVAVFEKLEKLSYEDFEWVFNVNFWGVVYGTRAFLPYLKQRPEGHIVNISSINGMVPFPDNGPYNVAKFALRGFNLTLVQEMRGTPVHVTSVHPGGIQTNIVRNARFRKPADREINQNDLVEVFASIAKTTPDQAARKIVKGIKKNRERLLVGLDAKFIDAMSRLAPLTTLKITAIIHEFLLARKAGQKKG